MTNRRINFIETDHGIFPISYNRNIIHIGDFTFSDDLRSVSHEGRHLWDFTKTQSQIIGWMLDHLQNGFKSIHQDSLIEKLQDRRFKRIEQQNPSKLKNTPLKTKRLRDFFKTKEKRLHPSFGSILKATRGRDSKITFDLTWRPT